MRSPKEKKRSSPEAKISPGGQLPPLPPTSRAYVQPLNFEWLKANVIRLDEP